MKRQRLFDVIGIMTAILLLMGTLPSQSAGKSFYEGKTIVELNGWNVGSGPDLHGRLVARHLGRFIPGHPQIIVKSRPGASGTVAMNYIYHRAKTNGLIFGNATSGLLTRQLIKFEGVRFDFRKIPLLSSNQSQSRYFYVRGDLGITSVEDMFKFGKPVITSWQARAGGPDVQMELMFRMLGLERKALYGFKGEPEARLALLRGEADMSASNEMTYLTIGKPLEQKGQTRIIVQCGVYRDGKFVRSETLSHVPTFSEAYEKHFGKPPSGIEWEAFKALATVPTRNYWGVPKTPSDRIQTLRKAFVDMSKDAKFQTESDKILGYVEKMDYEGKMKLIDAYISLPKEISDLLTP